MSKNLDLALLEIDKGLESGSVITDPEVLESFSKDESEVPPVLPDAVIRPRSTPEVAAVMRAANKYGIPITPRAAGTGRVGGAVPTQGGIVLTCERMSQILGIEPKDGYAITEPGVILGEFHKAIEEKNLFYPPDPNSSASCALGGNIAANAGGPRAYKYGVTRDYVLGLTVVTATGEVLNVGRRTKKGVTGYDLTGLLVGSEGTLGIVTEATVRIVAKPQRVVTLMVFLPNSSAAAVAIEKATQQAVIPRCIELLDSETLEIMRPQRESRFPKMPKQC